MSWLDQLKQKKAPLRRLLKAWFTRVARDLPWRRTRDPYAIWVSEIMLQQTRVDTVVPYYDRFLREFPNVGALADADLDRVLKLWEGLGYYSRARNLHKGAKAIARDRAGQFPATAKEWQEIPGVGRYTAGAIASIAYGERAPLLDGNVKRVFARIFGIEECIDDTATLHDLWTLAEELVPPSNPGDFNQALMELGAGVCTPRNPQCSDCPVGRHCEAKRLNLQKALPVRKPRKPIPHYEIVAAAIRRDGAYLLGRRREDAMLGGLWEFPGGKVEPGETHPEALIRELQEELEIEVRVGDWIASVDHAYSHFSITLHIYFCDILKGDPKPHVHSAVRWVPRSDFDQYAFPKADLLFMDKLP